MLTHYWWLFEEVRLSSDDPIRSKASAEKIPGGATGKRPKNSKKQTEK